MNGLNSSLKRLIALQSLNYIVEKVLCCIAMMIRDNTSCSQKIPNKETDICNHLFYHYLNNDEIVREVGLDEFRFFSEVPENYIHSRPTGRVDLQVFGLNEFKHRDRYFIIECKRIDGTQKLNREYIENGMQRFIGESSKYTSYYHMNCMLGFLVQKIEPSVIVDRMNQLLQTEYSDIQTHKYLREGTVQNTFISSHGFNDDTRIELIHAFADCSSILE